MDFFRRTTTFTAFAASFALGMLAISACRTSRQETSRKQNAERSQTGGNLSARMDSLLLVEQKLIEVIDSMTDLVESDHARIRSLEQRLEQIQGSNTSVPPATNYSDEDRTPSYSAPPPSYTAPASPPTFEDRYASALAAFNNHDIAEALAGFQSLEKDDPNSSYAGNYKYWEGECYYSKGHYNDALQAFGMVLERYPNSMKAAAAQFKTGECYEKMKIVASARAAYERVIADYPNSEFRPRAEARLKALKSTKDL